MNKLSLACSLVSKVCDGKWIDAAQLVADNGWPEIQAKLDQLCPDGSAKYKKWNRAGAPAASHFFPPIVEKAIKWTAWPGIRKKKAQWFAGPLLCAAPVESALTPSAKEQDRDDSSKRPWVVYRRNCNQICDHIGLLCCQDFRQEGLDPYAILFPSVATENFFH